MESEMESEQAKERRDAREEGDEMTDDLGAEGPMSEIVGRQENAAGGVDPEPQDGDGTGIYVYCIIQSRDDREFGPVGIAGDENQVYTLRHGDLAAVVSEVPLRVYDPTRENIVAHETVNKTVMEEFTVIPMSFGTLFRTDEDILALLDSTEDALRDVLDKMQCKVEMGLKVLWDQEKVTEVLEEKNEEFGRLREQMKGAEEGSTYFARVQLARMLENGLEEMAEGYVSDIFETLEPVAVASRTNKPVGEQMILNAAFLIDRERREEFDEAVEELGEKYGELLSLTYTGPWPPYNFVNIKLRLERAER